MNLLTDKQTLRARPKEDADFMIMVDNQKPELKEIANWLKMHSAKKSQ